MDPLLRTDSENELRNAYCTYRIFGEFSRKDIASLLILVHTYVHVKYVRTLDLLSVWYRMVLVRTLRST
jgi:hypothetical protein